MNRQVALQEELRNIRLALSLHAPPAPHPPPEPGVRAEVRDGPCRGLRSVIKAGRRGRLILQLEVLGRAVFDRD